MKKSDKFVNIRHRFPGRRSGCFTYRKYRLNSLLTSLESDAKHLSSLGFMIFVPKSNIYTSSLRT